MSSELTAALIAAGVSVLVAVLSATSTRRALLSDRAKQERELQRRITERLLDLRLKAYPAAFEITDILRGENLFKSVSAEFLVPVREQLTVWNRGSAALILSEKSLSAYRELREALAVAINEQPPVTAPLAKRIREAKNQFRRALKDDLGLLYAEEKGPGR